MLTLETKQNPYSLSVASDITGLIGKTPLVKINKLADPDDAQLYAKIEWYNIGWIHPRRC